MVMGGEQALNIRHRASEGAVLLEVVLALALLLFAIGVVNSGLQASVDAVDRMKANTQAMNLAVSVMSEIQMGIIPMETTEAQPFLAPFEDWSYAVQVENFGESLLGLARPIKVEVTVKHATKPFTRRLAQVMPPGNPGSADLNPSSPSPASDSNRMPSDDESAAP
jgi:type II secretory pathway pseudopilin PulG